MTARFAMVVIGMVAVVLPVPGMAPVGVTLWAVALVLWRWTVGIQRGIEVTWSGPPRVQPGATAAGVVTVRNRSRWPVPWLEVTLRMPAGAMEPHAFGFVLRLRARRQRRFDVVFVAGDRGAHEPRELSWRAADPIGLSWPSGTGSWRGTTVVVPRLAPVRRLVLPARSPLAELPQPRSLFADHTALVGVREYERGDPLSSIHWPATARTGRLMRTEDERAAARELLVCLDLAVDAYQRRGRPPVTEAAVSTAASLLADTVIGARQQAGLALSRPAAASEAPGSTSRVWPVRGGDRHLHGMLDALARVGLHDATPLATVVQRALRGLHAGTTVIVVTGMVDDSLAGVVAAVRRRGLDITVITVGSGVRWQSRLRSNVAGAPCVPVASDRALQRLPL